jgi:hypothetical protein
MSPRAAELKTKIDRLIDTDVSGGSEYNDTIDKWGTARRDADLSFRTQLRNGALNAYQRDPYTGENLRVSSKNWEDAPVLPGEDLEFPPIYFVKSGFEAWLSKSCGKVP